MGRDASLLSVQSLSLRIGSSPWLIKDLSFEVHAGKTTALVGESGSGKSLTARTVMQLLPPKARFCTKTDILLAGESLFACSEERMRGIRGQVVSFISQDALFAFNPVLRIGQQLLEAMRIHQPGYMRKHLYKKKILELFDRVGLKNPEQVFAAYPHQCSGGMLQRALIAMALSNQPKLLIADEPTTSLDTMVQAQIITLLKDLQQQLSMAMLFITHDLGLVKQVADSVVVLRQGKLVESSPATTFFRKPKQAYSRVLLQAATLPVGARKPEPVKPPLLTFSKLSFAYDDKVRWWFRKPPSPVLADVSGQVHAGATLALIGASGSGKTTLAKIMVGLNPYHQGTVLFAGDPLTSGIRARSYAQLSQINYVFQNPFASLNPRMTVGQILAEPLWVQQGKRYAQTLALQEAVLEKVSLPKTILDQYPQQFSGGERARIALARALILQPKLLIFDEPTTALDVSLQKQLLVLMKQLQHKYAMTYLLITHDFNVVRFMADHVMVLHEGRVVESGTVNQVLHKPQHQQTQQLLAAMCHV
jgi:ABC-type microcin C transport system duplicated ATPase subunit YejF